MTTTPQQQTHTPWRLEHAPTPTNRQRQRIVDASGQWVDLCDREDLNPQIVAAVNACAGLSDPAAALQAAREALEELLPLGLCGCDDQEDKETGAHPSESSLGNTAFDGTPIWGEPCKYCKARAALQQLRGEAQP